MANTTLRELVAADVMQRDMVTVSPATRSATRSR